MLVLFLSHAALAQIPETVLKNAQGVLDDLMHSRGEKVYEQSDDEMKAAITAPQLNSLWIGLVMQFGPCKEVSDWKGQLMNRSQVVTCRLHFEKQMLMFMVSYQDGKINGLRVMPDSSATPAASSPGGNRKPEVNEDFEEREVTVVTGNFELPGFLTVPRDGTGFPCVVLVHGSGPNDRDETLLENRPFQDLAWGLARRGIATLRYDKRAYVYGTRSVPEGEELTLANEVTEDALSAVKLAATQKGIDPGRIFVLGHSLGGAMAPQIAACCPGLKGIILMAGSARPLDVLIAEQITYLNSLNPTPGWENQLALLKKQFDNVRKSGTPDYDPSVSSPLGQPLSYWQSLDNYRQTEVAEGLTLPVLILNGEKDYNVTLTDFNIWKKALGGKKNVTFKAYPGLNHLFMQSSEKPTPEDYETPRHIPEYVTGDIAGWIKKQN